MLVGVQNAPKRLSASTKTPDAFSDRAVKILASNNHIGCDLCSGAAGKFKRRDRKKHLRGSRCSALGVKSQAHERPVRFDHRMLSVIASYQNQFPLRRYV